MSHGFILDSTIAQSKAEAAQNEQTSVMAQDAVETTDESEASEETKLEASPNEADSEESQDSEESDKEQERKPKSNGFEKRIRKFQKELSKAKQEAELWKSEALKGKEAKQEAEKKPDVREAGDKNKRPKADDYDSHEDYVDAVTDWKLERFKEETARAEKETQVKSEYQNRVSKFQSSVAELFKEHDEFKATLEDLDDIPMSLGVEEALLESEIGAKVLHELSKDRANWERINSLPFVSAAREIGKVEARLDSEKSEEPNRQDEKKITKAPSPVSPVGNKGGGSTKRSIFDKDISFAEYERIRSEEMKAKRA